MIEAISESRQNKLIFYWKPFEIILLNFKSLIADQCDRRTFFFFLQSRTSAEEQQMNLVVFHCTVVMCV